MSRPISWPPLAPALACVVFLAAGCAADRVRVAAVGDSITFGHSIDDRDRDSYPAQLERLLGRRYEVMNFGVNATTVLSEGDRPYRETDEYAAALAYEPDVVIIKLGTNDTKPHNWEFESQFVADYTALIDAFEALPSKPEVWVALPVPAYGMAWDIQPATLDAEVVPRVKAIAAAEGVGSIDLHTPLSGHPEWFPDEIHPTVEGAAEIARVVFEALQGS